METKTKGYTMILFLHVLVLRVTGVRWSKTHRHNDTWQYRYLKTTMANIKADIFLLKTKGV